MKIATFAVLLSIVISLGMVPIEADMAGETTNYPAGPNLYSILRAYREFLLTPQTIMGHGFDAPYTWDIDSLVYATLADLDNDGLPELLVVARNQDYNFVSNLFILRYNNGIEIILNRGMGILGHTTYSLAETLDGQIYLFTRGSGGLGLGWQSYFALINDYFHNVMDLEHGMDGQGVMHYRIDEESATEEQFENAGADRLGVINYRSLEWPITPYNGRMLLAEIDATLATIAFEVSQTPVSQQTNIMVPIRLLLESIGYNVYMENDTQTTVVTAGAAETTAATYIIIDGLQLNTNLTALDLSSRQLTDITPLAGLTNLTYLRLHNNQISDIIPLANLTNLTVLVLNSNQISDITPLAGLTNLTNLDLSSNQISNLAPLAGLTSLTSLSLSVNEVMDITPLNGLTNLTVLDLFGNQITNVTPISGLINLTELSLMMNQVSNIAPLAGLTNLESLSLSVNQIMDITPLASLTNLTWLSLPNNQIYDITPLAGLRNLSDLAFFSEQITDWSPVAHVENVWGRPQQ